MKEFVWLRAKTYSYLKENNDENKKAKGKKKSFIERELKFQDYKNCLSSKLKFQDYKNCLSSSQIGNIIKFFEKKGIDTEYLKETTKTEFIKNWKKLKTQQRFKSERHNVFTEEIQKITFSSDDDKRIKSITLIETYVYGTSKGLMCKEEKMK